MARTQVRTKQVLDQGITKDDLNTTTLGQAVITKVLGGIGVNIDWTGVDEGTGVVTISASGGQSFSYHIVPLSETVEISQEQQMAVHGDFKVSNNSEVKINGELVIAKG